MNIRLLCLSLLFQFLLLGQFPEATVGATGGGGGGGGDVVAAGSNTFLGSNNFSATSVFKGKTGSGAPAASACNEVGEVGNEYINSDEAAGERKKYFCFATDTGTYEWIAIQQDIGVNSSHGGGTEVARGTVGAETAIANGDSWVYSTDAGINRWTNRALKAVLRTHATDCTALTDGVDGQACWEKDANTIYVCEPTAGGCDTAGEWILATGAAGVGYTSGASDPATCTPAVTADFHNTTENVRKVCSATNTWTPLREVVGGAGMTVSNSGSTSTIEPGSADWLTRTTDQAATDIYLAPAGLSGTAYTACPTPSLAAQPATGSRWILLPDVASSANATLNVCSQGALNLQKLSSGSLTNIAANDLRANVPYVVMKAASSYVVVPLEGGAGDVTGGSTSTDGELAAYNGTGGKTLKQSFAKFSGPASTVKTYTLPNASAVVLTDNAVVTVAQGGTSGATSQAAINALSQLTTNGDLLYHNGTDSTRLPRGLDTQCLTSNTTTILWASCGAGSGDSIAVNASAATDANFIDTAASGTVAGVVWTLATGPTPDTISVVIGTASGTVAGIITTGTQTMAGAKTFSTSVASPAFISGAADPADAGVLRCGNNEICLAGEAATPGTDLTWKVNTSDQWESSVAIKAPGFVGTGDPYIELPQGAATAVAANSWRIIPPTSITTGFRWIGPSAVGATGVIKCTVSGTDCTLSAAAIVDADVPDTITLTNITQITNRAFSDLSGYGTGVATLLATPSSANLAAALTDETGSGLSLFVTAASSTVGQVLRVTGAAAYGFGAVDLADTDAVTGVLPAANWTLLTTEGDIVYRNATVTARLPRGLNGECLTSNTTTILWGTCGGGGVSWSGITAPTGAVLMTSDGTTETATFDYQAAFTTGSQFLIMSSIGNPTGGILFEVRGHDAQVSPFKITADGTNGMQMDATGLLVAIGTGGIQANTVVANAVALTTGTTGNYVASVATTALYLTGGAAGSEGAALTLTFDYTSTLAGNPALNADECVFSTDGTGGGIICEGNTADTIEGLLLWNPTTADRTLTFPDATDTLVGKATTDIFTNKTFNTAGTGNVFQINGTGITAVTGTGSVVLATSATLVTPALGTPASGVMTNVTGLPTAGLVDGAVTTAKLATTGKTFTKSINIFDPVAGDSGRIQLMFPLAVTITRISCATKTATSTVTMNFEERVAATPDTAGTAVLTSNLVCDTDEQASTTFTNATIASRVPMALTIASVANAPTDVRIQVEYTVD